MNETTRTLTFVGIAIAALAAAFVTDRASQPVELTGYENVGTEFYPDFTDPTQAKSLRVVDYDEDSATLKVFNVEFKDGLWKIPSHHDYPADAEDELAETAASLVGVVRGALESRRKSDHERFGVIDPLDDANTNLKGRGQRLTLLKEGDTPLVDFIIGKQVPDQPNEYYVRKVDEDSVYRTNLDIDLSSEFSDWIEPDLLKVERDRLVEIIVNKYSIDEGQGRIVDRELATLKRKKSTDPWELEGLNKATEKLNTSDVNQMINTLSDLKIQGIRPKPTGIAEGLKKSGTLQLNRRDFIDLQSKGFILAQDPQGNQQLVSNEGEVIAATNEGVVYSLYFGEIFTGSALDIEIGNSGKKKEKGDSPKSADKKDPTKKEDQKTDDAALQTSRYLFVTVSFDPSFLGDPPSKPKEPKKPTETKKEEKTDTKKENATKKKDAKAADKKEDSSKTEKKPDPQAEYEVEMKKYESQLKTYERLLKDYDAKVVKGNELVQKLNKRFADWYYVISAKSFDTLRMSRKALVEPIEKPKEESDKPGAPKTDPVKPSTKKSIPAVKPTAPKKTDPAAKKKPSTKASSSPSQSTKPVKKPTTKPPVEKKPDKPEAPKAKPKAPSKSETTKKD